MNTPSLLYRYLKNYRYHILIPLLLAVASFGITRSVIPFEKGIDIVKSRGYPLDGNNRCDLTDIGDLEVTKLRLGSFLTVCERIRGEVGAITVYTDYYARALFIFDYGQNVMYVCELR